MGQNLPVIDTLLDLGLKQLCYECLGEVSFGGPFD
jgi:hypothetical protein